MATLELLSIDRQGSIALPDDRIPGMVGENCAGHASYYGVVGFEPPWIGYVSVADGRVVGGGAFKGAPRHDRVEIAYYTLPELEGRGWAKATAGALVELALATLPEVLVAAQTLPGRSASTSVLERLGFRLQGVVVHPDDGEVWEWHRTPGP